MNWKGEEIQEAKRRLAKYPSFPELEMPKKIKIILMVSAALLWLLNYHFIHIIYRLTGISIILY